MASGGLILLILGAFLLGGFLAHLTGQRFPLPRVTVLLILGALLGPSALDLIPEDVSNWFPLITHMALGMVGFLLGENFQLSKIKRIGRRVLCFSAGEIVLAAVAVFFAVLATGASLTVALVLAGIAPASAPAAIVETVREYKAKGPLTDTVLGVVAVDDAWGVLIFTALFAVAQAVSGAGVSMHEFLRAAWDIGGAIVLGAVIGFPMAWITSRVREGDITLVEAADFVFLGTGAALALDVSYLLAAIVMGIVVANVARPPRRPFNAIENVREPFLAIFFILSGIHFDLEALLGLGLLGLVYIAGRAAGLIGGAWIVGRLIDAPAAVRNNVGWCILPQAGVALGFALLVKESLPEVGDRVLTLVVASTVLFEITGPALARWRMRRAGELEAGSNPD